MADLLTAENRKPGIHQDYYYVKYLFSKISKPKTFDFSIKNS